MKLYIYNRVQVDEREPNAKTTPLLAMRSIDAAEYAPAIAVFGLGEGYLALALVYAHFYPRSFSNVRRCLLKAASVIYLLVSATFITAFFITRRISRTHTPAFVLFCGWEVINGLCLGAEIVRVAEH
jgi:tellurite resistance protein TehA-like permease